VVVDFLFYSAQRFVYPSVIFTVFFGVFMNDRNEYRESASDDSHHNRSIHFVIVVSSAKQLDLAHNFVAVRPVDFADNLPK